MNCPGRRKLTTSSTGSVLLPLMTRTFLLPTKNCKLPEPYLSIDFINGYCLWTESFEIFETPEWVLFWLKRSHLVFLVLAIACFSVGLVLFVILLVRSWPYNRAARTISGAAKRTTARHQSSARDWGRIPFRTSDTSSFIARQRWQDAAQTVIALQRGAPSTTPTGPIRDVTTPVRAAHFVPALKEMKATQMLQIHRGSIRDLQFSPDGRMVASSSEARIVRQLSTRSRTRSLPIVCSHIQQALWEWSSGSPIGNMLLTKLQRTVKLWTEDGVCRKTIDRRTPVQSVAWFPEGELFLLVEGNSIINLDLNGVVSGSLVASEEGLQPDKSRSEKQIVVYNLYTRRSESRAPVLRDARNISLTKAGTMALVSYDDMAPPQLWEMQYLISHSPTRIRRLILCHTYVPKGAVDFAGPSSFGGNEDPLVIAVGKNNEIHIWDRDSAFLIHYVRPQSEENEISCIAWNHGYDSLMFATGSQGGMVKVWTVPDPSSAKAPVGNIPEYSYSTHPSRPPSLRTPNSPIHRQEQGGHGPEDISTEVQVASQALSLIGSVMSDESDFQ